MSRKYCDRCKREMNMHPMIQCQNPLFRIEYIHPMGIAPIDLCESCSKEFVEWVRKGVEDSRN